MTERRARVCGDPADRRSLRGWIVATALLALPSLPSIAQVATAAPPATADPAVAGAPVTVRMALEDLRRRGLPIVFSSTLVPDDLVTTESGARDRASLRDQALALLAPHGLTLAQGPLGIFMVVRGTPGASIHGPVTLEGPPPPPAEADRVRLDIVVTSPYSILGDEATPSVGLTRQQILELPHFGDDLNRAVRAMPATSGNEAGARFNVRGGLYDEVLVSLDGFELFAPFHLEDLTGIFSILDPELVDQADLFAGSFPAAWGDRMTAVLDLRTRTPSADHWNAGISFSNAWLGAARVFGGGRGRWLGSARRGYIDLVLDFIDQEADIGEEGETPDPRYWDAFSKLDFDLATGSTLSLEGLFAGDTANFSDSDDPADQFRIDSQWRNRHLGLAHQLIASPTAFAVTTASAAVVDRDRVASERAPREEFHLADVRALEVLGLRQVWTVEAGDRHIVTAGAELRHYDADYDYRNDFDLPDPIDDPRFFSRSGFVEVDRTIEGSHLAIHASDRARFERLTIEAGGRFDRQTWFEDEQLSPRLGLALDLGSGSALHLAWGRFFQSQRPHELDIEFGDDRLFPAAGASHWTLGFERQGRRGALRADGYLRRISSPQPRYETLFDPLMAFPEVAADRILIEADDAEARGLELTWKQRGGTRLSWWAYYSLSEVSDRVDGRNQRRSIDQTHALTANLSWRPSEKWVIDWLWTYHTGWPGTSLSGELLPGPDGRLVVVHHVGPFYAERLADYHRLDLRASRVTRVAGGELRFFVDVQNLYDRENARGRDLEDERIGFEDGAPTVAFPDQTWFGILPSFGVSWRR